MVRFEQTRDSGQSTENPRSLTLKYLLEGIFGRNVARAYAIAATPSIASGLYRQDVKMDPGGFQIWFATVTYGPTKQRTIGEVRWNVDTTGGTAHITQALEHVQSYPKSGMTAPDHKGAIGVKRSNGERTVEGCDIVVPACKWTEAWTLSAAAAAFDYIDTLEALTGNVNNATFRGKAAGEVRFDGAVGGGSNVDPTQVEMTFHFTRSISVTNLTAGDITGIAKAGWQYLWYEYETQVDTNAQMSTEVPLAAHVERVYNAVDFSLLGIGTASLPANLIT
jgi:hypothetical protein